MLCGGIALALQPSINVRLAQKIGNFESSFISFLVGAIAMLIVVWFTGKGGLKEISHVSWWELTGGLLGAFFVTLSIIIVPRIGTTAAMAALIAGQLTTAAVLDHFGAFGLKHIPISPMRVAGVLLLFTGAVIIAKK